jgi:type II secretory pathway pseudopilin PulG
MNARGAASGFSLIEVVVALGLLAGVLISVAGLFSVGAQRVKSGRTSSEVLAAARAILEEMSGWGFRQTYLLFDDAACRGTDAACLIDTTTNPFASRWQARLDEIPSDARAEIRLEALDGAPPTLATTDAIRLSVTVLWREGQRSRNLELSTVRM